MGYTKFVMALGSVYIAGQPAAGVSLDFGTHLPAELVQGYHHPSRKALKKGGAK